MFNCITTVNTPAKRHVYCLTGCQPVDGQRAATKTDEHQAMLAFEAHEMATQPSETAVIVFSSQRNAGSSLLNDIQRAMMVPEFTTPTPFSTPKIPSVHLMVTKQFFTYPKLRH